MRAPSGSRRMKKRLRIVALLGLCLGTTAYVTCGNPPVADLTKGRSSVCEVHSLDMQERIIPIVYGLPGQSEFEKMDASINAFPHGRNYVLGGCIRGKSEKAIVYRCSRCEDVREQWIRDHGHEKTNRP